MLLNNNLRQVSSEKKFFVMNNSNYVDIESYRDEIKKLKIELNKKKKDIGFLKVKYLKLDKQNQSSLKLLEQVVNESNSTNFTLSKTYSGLFDQIKNKRSSNETKIKNEENKNKNMNENTQYDELNSINDGNKTGTNFAKKTASFLCNQTINKIKEKFLFNRMKQEINKLKEEITEKNTLMKNLKNNSKIIKLRELDNKYAETYNELVFLKENYKKVENIQNDYFNAKMLITELSKELHCCRKQIKIQKEQLEKLNIDYQNNLTKLEKLENEKNVENRKKKVFKNENEKLKQIINGLNKKNMEIIDELVKVRKIKPPTRNLAKVEIENKQLKKENFLFAEEIKKLKNIIKTMQENNSKDNFFMTSAPISLGNGEKKSDNEAKTSDKEDKENMNNSKSKRKNSPHFSESRIEKKEKNSNENLSDNEIKGQEILENKNEEKKNNEDKNEIIDNGEQKEVINNEEVKNEIVNNEEKKEIINNEENNNNNCEQSMINKQNDDKKIEPKDIEVNPITFQENN